MGLGGVSAWAAGDGSQGNPYTGGISDLDLSENKGWTAEDTVYIDGWTSGYWVIGTGDSDNKYITFKANIEIGANGMTLTNAYSETEYTFAGNISGVGDWIFSGPSASATTPTQRYVFLGDMSDYSGHMSITAASQAKWRGYLHFGDGGKAATDTNISGTGSITTTTTGNNDIDIVFNYGSYADENSQAITIGNSYISTNSLEFKGTVNYIVSSDLIGTGSNSALKITNTGEDGASATTKITGSISGFSSITVAEGSTLELAGDVELNNAISNSGTVVVDSTVRFAIDNLSGTAVENSDGTSYTYTFVTGDGSVTGWSGLDYDNFTLDGVDIGRSIIEVGAVDGQITITFVDGEDLTWNGIGEDNVWENLGTNWKGADTGEEGTFYNHDSVTFGTIEDSGISSTVVIAETMSTGSIAVQDSYTFTTDVENGVTVKTSTLTVDEGSVLTVGDGVTIYVETVGNFSVAGAITGTGTLEFDFDTSYTTSINLGSNKLGSGTEAFSGTIYIHSGNIELDLSDIGNGGYIFADGVNAQVSGAITIPNLTLEGETTLQKANNTTTDTSVSITNLTLENGAILTFYTTDSNPSTYKNQGLYIGELTLTGSWAEIRTQYWQNYISITSLIGENATLYLGSTAGSSATNLYELGTSGNTSSTSLFTGKIVLSDSDSGSRRSVGLVISEQYIAAGAVIEMGTEASGDGTLSLGVNASTVEIAGLVSSSNHGGTDIVYSGAVTTGTDLGANGTNLINHSGDNYSGVSASVNTLVINVTDGESYEFHGIILDSLNIEKKGKGTQAIEFQANSSFNGKVTVSAGTLSLSGVSDSGTAISTSAITVAAESTLSLSDLTISLGSAIENSGTVAIDESSVTFVLDGLELQYSRDQTHSYYEVISSNSGTLTFADPSGSLSNSNFTLDGSEISSSWTVYVSEDGFVYVYSDVEADLYWAGTSDTHSWKNDTSVKDWTMGEGGTTEAFFSDGASVHFGTITENSPYAIVNVVGEVTASSTTINDSYTFTTSDSGAVINTGALTVTADGISFVAENGASLTVNIESLTMSGNNGNNWGADYKMTFSGAVTATIGEYNYERFHVENGAVLDLTQANYTAGGNGYIYIDGEGSTVKVSELKWGNGSNFGASMYNNRIQISNGGILEVTAAQSNGSGGGERGFAVTEGEGTYRYSGDGTSYIHSTERNIHLGGTTDADAATLIFDVVNSGATLDVSMVIAKGLGNDSDVIGSVTTSTGSLVKTGAGTLILEATNLYSGGTKIQQGVLVAKNSSALGTGTISIEGGQLSIDSGITISNTVNVTFSEVYRVESGEITTGFYAIAGEGSLSTTGGVEITLFLDEAMMELLISEGELYFALMETDVNSEYETDFSISLSEALSSYDYEYYENSGVVRIFLPEPELFSVFFGISALGLMATRRRRRKVA